jgi:RecA-family ATPase
MFVPEAMWGDVVDWVCVEAERGTEFIVIDPITNISWTDGKYSKSHEVQEKFMNEIIAVAAGSNVHVLFVLHFAKRKFANQPLTGDDIQGSTAFHRFAYNTWLLQRHDWQDSVVFRTGGIKGAATHNRTLRIEKARKGCGTGTNIAFSLESTGPRPHEIGVICPKEK